MCEESTPIFRNFDEYGGKQKCVARGSGVFFISRYSVSIETYALYVRCLCKTINYDILYIKYVERISSSVCVLSGYIMRYIKSQQKNFVS